MGSAAYWVGHGLTVLAVLAVVGGFTFGNLASPVFFSGDAMHHLAIAQAIGESGWWWQIDRLSAPFVANFQLFPVAGLLDSGLFAVISVFTRNPVVIVNTFWILSFVFSGLSATWSLRQLQISRPVAWSLGILFAFSPHAFFRNTNHLMLVTYFVPPLAAAAILLLRGKWAELGRREKLIFGCLFVGLGLDYVYTAFFGCFVLMVAGLLAWVDGKRDSLRVAALSIALVAGASGLALAPSLYAWRKDPQAKQNVSAKSVAEADYYGLKLRHLLLPIPNHPLAVFRAVNEKFAKADFPLETENGNARLGLVGAIGFLILIAASLLGTIRRPGLQSVAQSLQAPAALNLAVVLLATIGGLGSIFNTLISPDVRCYNRAAIYIAFFALCAIAMLLERMKARAAGAGGLVALGVLVTLGLADQTTNLRAQRAQATEDFRSLASFVGELEAKLPPGAMIFELPMLPYPNTPPKGRMVSQQHLAPYVVSKSLRWTFAALSSTALHFNQHLLGDSPADMARDLAIAGFAGLWIDTSAYADGGAQLVQQLVADGLPAPLASPDGKFLFLSLQERAERLRGDLGPARLEAERSQLLETAVLHGPLPPEAFRAQLQVDQPLSTMGLGSTAVILLHIKNTGPGTLTSVGLGDGMFAVSASYRWLTPTREVAIEYGVREHLHGALGPGDETTLQVEVEAPPVKGQYILELDLVQEGVEWFEKAGSTPVLLSVSVSE